MGWERCKAGKHFPFGLPFLCLHEQRTVPQKINSETKDFGHELETRNGNSLKGSLNMDNSWATFEWTTTWCCPVLLPQLPTTRPKRFCCSFGIQNAGALPPQHSLSGPEITMPTMMLAENNISIVSHFLDLIMRSHAVPRGSSSCSSENPQPGESVTQRSHS